MKRRDALHHVGRFGGAVLLLGPAQLVWGASIVSVRVWPSSEYTRLTIESDQSLVARHFLTEQPDRLVVDIDGLELDPALKDLVGKIRPDDPYIASVRVGQFQPKVVRLVLDLKRPVKPQQFALQPVAAYQHRLVFDLYPTQPVDPLQALINDKLQAEQSAAQSVQDALGEFIGKVDQGPGTPTTTVASASAPRQITPRPSDPSPSPPTPSRDKPTAVASAADNGKVPASKSSRGNSSNRAMTAAQKEKINRLIVVAVDPGHGGEDPGATGPSGLHEKDVVLKIATQLRDRLNDHPNIRAMMTRDADFFVPLGERVAKARRVQADLFVSIHADAFITPQARGASVFALSDRGATSTAARWMANRENAADVVGGTNLVAKDATVLRAMLDMSTTAQIKDSLKVGREVLSRIGTVGKLHKGEVEQAGFAVLKAPDIPSILVETAFISNPDEEAKLKDPDYQDKLVAALFTGITRYFDKNPPLERPRET